MTEATNSWAVVHPTALADLRASGLSNETIVAAGLRTITGKELVLKLGRKLAAEVEVALEIPYDGKFSRFRLYPEVVDKDGKRQKYHQAHDTAPSLYVPPGSRSVLADPTVPIEILEGEKKSLKADQEGIRCLAIGGVWNWMHRGKPLPDLGRIDWLERDVTITPDSDTWTRPDLLQAIFALGKELESRSAKVTLRKLPAGANGAKSGGDDYLLTHQPDEYRALPRLPLAHKIFRSTAKWWRGWNGNGNDVAAQVGHRSKKKPSGEVAEKFNLTDLGNAERLVAKFGTSMRYVPEVGWLVFDGHRWQRDDAACAVTRLASTTLRAMYEVASRLHNDDVRRALVRHAEASESRPRIDAMVALAKSMTNGAIAEFDRDPLLVNFLNGSLDLRTMDLRPNRHQDRVTKLAHVVYDPDASAPRFQQFLKEIMQGNEDLIRFLQRAVGYSLTGLTNERVLFIFYGTGSNGKTTLLRVLGDALADYAMQTPTETLMLKREGAIPNDLARLAGARFVTAVEVSDGRKLDEALVKQVTGGDKVAARFLNKEWFEYVPQFKIFLATNHKPRIRGTDPAIWQRIRLIPFAERFDLPDKTLLASLRDELPGIIAWAVRGYQAWAAEGLGDVTEVREATAAYRAEEDVLGRFISERCVKRQPARVGSTAFYSAYQQWCEENGERPSAQRSVGIRLAEMGFTDKKTGGLKVWNGIGLLDNTRAGEQGSDGERPPGSRAKSPHEEETPGSGPDAPRAPLSQPESRRTERGGPGGMTEVPW